MAVFSSNAQKSLEIQMSKLYGNMNLSVGYNPEQHKVINKSLLNQIISSKEIIQSSSVLINHLHVDGLDSSLYTLGVGNDPLVKSHYHFSRNIQGNEVIINQTLAQTLNLTEGKTLLLENKKFTIKEIIADSNSGGTTSAILIVPWGTLKKIEFQKTGILNEATYVLIQTAEKTDNYELANSIHRIDQELRIDIAEQDPFLQKNMKSLRFLIITISFLILLVTSLIIISNLQAFMYKYKHEFAVMRSFGAKSTDLFKIILLQSSLLNICGATLGYIVSLIFNTVSQQGLQKIFSESLATTQFNHGYALVTTLISMVFVECFMLIPAYRSTKILPLKIMQDNEQNEFTSKQGLSKAGKIFCITGIVVMIWAKVMMNGGDTQTLGIAVAIILTMVGLFLLFPVYLPQLLSFTLLPIRKSLGNYSFIAVKNTIPQIRKNTFIILIIAVTMVITIFGASLMKTIQNNEQSYLESQYPTNIVISNRAGKNLNENYKKLVKDIKQIPGVEGASTVSVANSASLIKNNKKTDFVYSFTDLNEMANQGLLPHITQTQENNIIITKKIAKEHNLNLHETMKINIYPDFKDATNTSTVSAKIAGIYDQLPGTFADAYVDWGEQNFLTNYTIVERVFISTVDPNTNKVVVALEELKQKYAGLQVDTLTNSLEQSNKSFYQRWAIFITVIIVILLSVMLGVFSTLISNVYSKRKEFAILRNLSVTGKGIVQIILTQVILYIVLGVCIGFIVGIALLYGLKFIDLTAIRINYLAIISVTAVLLISSFIIFVPYGRHLSKRNLPKELAEKS
ncbi:FtsX-like permease family protein [Paenibacillus sp. UKAQ_18]|nr:FtsX-like permease family protein [Paenibacillus sp. UKAQ_18]